MNTVDGRHVVGLGDLEPSDTFSDGHDLYIVVEREDLPPTRVLGPDFVPVLSLTKGRLSYWRVNTDVVAYPHAMVVVDIAEFVADVIKRLAEKEAH